MKRLFQLLAGLCITALACWVFFKMVDVRELPSLAAQVHPVTIVLIAVLALFSLLLRAFRLRLLLPVAAPGALPLSGLFSLITVSYMLNNILPFRLGEAGRVLLLARNPSVSLHQSLGTAFMERLLDSLGYALLLIGPVALMGMWDPSLRLLGKVPLTVLLNMALLLALGMVLFFLVVLFFPKQVGSGYQWLQMRLPLRLQQIVVHLERTASGSVAWMRTPWKVCVVLLLTLASVASYALAIYAIGLNLGANLSFGGALVASTIVAFGAALPSAPGFAGTMDVAMVAGLMLFSVRPETAAASALLYHVVGWLVVVIAGLVIWPRMNVSLSEIRKTSLKTE